MKATTKRITAKLISLVLSILILFYAIPGVVYAETIDALSGIGAGSEKAGNTEQPAADFKIPLYEAEELREENVKHFKLSDGSYVAAQYNYPVHYDDGSGKLLDINNALNEASGGVYANENARIKFAKKITGNSSLFTLHDGSTKLTMSLNGAKKGTKGAVTNGEDNKETTELQKMMNLENLSSNIVYADILDGVDVEYELHSLNIKENIIVKERKSEYIYSFELSLNGLTAALSDLGDVELTDEKTGEIKYVIPAPVIFDANGQYASSGVGAYTLSGGGNGKYTLTVTVASEWMNSSDRAFPVTVDPTISAPSVYMVDLSISSINPDSVSLSNARLYVSSTDIAFLKIPSLPSLPSSAYVMNAEITMTTAVNTYTGYVLLYDVLTSWNTSLTWNKHVSTTSPQGKLSDKPTDYIYISEPGSYTWNVTSLYEEWMAYDNYGFALKKADGTNTDTAFHSYEASQAANQPTLTVIYKNLAGAEPYWSYSSHSAGVAGNGSINLATGKLTVSLPTLSTTDSLIPYTPTLIYNSDLASKGYFYPNADTSNTIKYTPLGFKLNICETVLEDSYTNTSGQTVVYYIYADADGTEHGFYPSGANSNVYFDESGLQKTLTVLSDGSIEITDDTKTVKTFTKNSNSYSGARAGFYLSKITDKNGNAVIFTFDSALRPTKVSIKPNGVAQIDFLDLYYYSTGMLKMVYNSASRDAVVFRYSGTYSGSISTSSTEYLRRVDFAHGNSSVTLSNWDSFAASASNTTNITLDATAEYTYNSYGEIVSAKDLLLNQSLVYEWTSDKITAITHVAGASTNGQKVYYYYGNGYTDVTASGKDELPDTEDDIITRYVFDREGRSKSVYSFAKNGTEIYGATVGEYETQDNIKNNIKEKAVLGGSGVNYLLNGNFEDYSSATAAPNWQISGDVQIKSALVGLEGMYGAAFASVGGSIASLSQYVSLAGGKYTLSFNYHTTISDKCSAYVVISSVSGSGFFHTESISLNQNYNNGSLSTFSTSFTLPEYAGGLDRLLVCIQLTSQASVTKSPSFMIDCVMLENNLGASDYSYVSYGNFEASVSNTQGTTAPLSSYWTTSNYQQVNVVTDDERLGNSAKLTASISNVRAIKQRVYQIDSYQLSLYSSGSTSFYTNAKEEYIVSGFGKSADAVMSGKSAFRIGVDVIYYQGGSVYETVSHYFDFLPDCTEWQFTGGTIRTDEPQASNGNDYSCVYAIDVYFEYSYQPNGYALFDNLSFTKVTGDAVERYRYYENGLLAVKENLFYTEYYEYDANRNLSRVANNRGELTDYTYTAKNQISTAIDYDFMWGQSKDYPNTFDNPDSQITKTPKNKTVYSYDSYGLVLCVESYPVDANLSQLSGSKSIYNRYVYSSSPGSKTFGAMVWEWDGLDVDIHYYYDSADGKLLATVNSDENTGVSYTYDGMDRLIGVTPASYVGTSSYSSVTGAEEVSYTYNSRNLLSAIQTESTTYTFTYDAFGNTTEIKAGANELCEYTYGERNGKLNKITYANGFVIEYVYNELELLAEVWYTKGTGTKQKVYEYEYTSDGQVHSFSDLANGKSTVYKYDTDNRLVGFVEYENGDHYHDYSSSVAYNDKGELDTVYYYLNYQNGATANDYYRWFYNHQYESDGKLSYRQIRTDNTNGGETLYYDDYDRVSSTLYNLYLYGNSATKFNNRIDYTYSEYSTHTSGQIKTYSSTVNSGTALTYTYTYDQNGNITKVVYSTGEEIRYVYDDLSQLIREDNGALGKTYVYTYDNAGNITSKKTYSLTAAGATPSSLQSTNSYGYSTSGWGDMLTSYRGQSISYDAIGNPLTYYNGSSYTFSWTGRQLTGATFGGNTYTFIYNDKGIRTSKTKNGVKTVYHLNDSQIAYEETNGNITVYLYDSNGLPIGMQYRGASYAANVWDIYWFEKNLQGDIIAVYDQAGNKLISYTYDAWGNTTQTYYNSGISTTAVNNPFRYRGYYYDADLGLYYLNTRCYDANTGRFISPDTEAVITATPDALTDKNLYAYCDNNPITRRDDGGEFWNWLVGGIVGAVGGAISAGVQGKKGEEFWSSVADGAVSGSVAGLVADVIVVTGGSAAVVMTASAFGGGAGALLGSVTEDAILGNKVDLKDALVDAGYGMVSGLLAGSLNGAQVSMMEDITSRAGKKALQRGISYQYAAKRTAVREFKNMGRTFAEESLSSFTSWLIQGFMGNIFK